MKITVNGEVLDTGFDIGHVSMAQALEIEQASKRRYVEWEGEILGGSAEATCVLVWAAWKRDGRDVPLKDILDGNVDVDFSDVYRSFTEAYVAGVKARAAENPTSGAAPLTGQAGTDTTPSGTRASSPKS